jgi:TfoX/Sxy family transcriptional regulator of competence genes
MTDPPSARDAGNDLLHALGAAFPAELGVSSDRMFNGRGLKTRGRFFAFVNSAGRLAVKLSEEDVQKLVRDGDAAPVTMGKRTMREWVSLPQPHADDHSSWWRALEAARMFAVSADDGLHR